MRVLQIPDETYEVGAPSLAGRETRHTLARFLREVSLRKLFAQTKMRPIRFMDWEKVILMDNAI